MVETEMQKQEKDPHETEQDFDLVDLDEEDEKESTKMILKEQEELIGELQVKRQGEKYIISYYEQENRQMETKHELMEVQLIKAKREAEKTKIQLEEAYGDYVSPWRKKCLGGGLELEA